MGAEDAAEREQFVSQSIRQMAAGGVQAQKGLTALYGAYRPRMLRFLQRDGLSEAAAEDVLQDAFIKLMSHAAQCRHEGGASGWMWRIVVNAARDAQRARRRVVDIDAETQQRLEAQLPDRSDGSDQAVDDCVARAFERFARQNADGADALRLMYVEEWKGEQVAAFLGRTHGATRTFLLSCRRAFAVLSKPCLELRGH